MLSKLRLENFLSWKEAELDFVPGVNAIVGISDSGKSNLIKAIRWNSLSKPEGLIIQSDWVKKNDNTSVTIDTIEGVNVSKIRNKTENTYILNGVEHKGFGRDVPDEIKKALNITDMNFQFQFDNPFILSQSASEVGRDLNKIVNLEIIDIASSNIEKTKRKFKSDLDKTLVDLDVVENKLLSYSNLDNIEIDLQILENSDKKLEDKIELHNTIIDLLDKINNVEDRVNNINSIQYEDEINTLIEVKKSTFDKVIKRNNLQSIYKTISQLEWKLKTANASIDLEKDLNNLIQQNKNIEFSITKRKLIQNIITKITDIEKSIKELDNEIKDEKLVMKLLNINDKILDAIDRRNGLDYRLTSILVLEKQIKDKDQSINKLEKEYKELLGDVCPLCNQEINK